MTSEECSALSKLLVPLTLLALVVYCVGFASPYWLTAEFLIPVAAPGLPVTSNLGLFAACNDITYPTGVKSDCSSDGAKDWQMIAAGGACVGLACGAVALVMSVVGVFVRRARGRRGLVGGMAAMDLLSAGGVAVPLILYSLNHSFVVDARLPTFVVTYGHAWAFKLSIAAAFLFVGLFVLCVVDMMTHNTNTVDFSGDDKPVAYSARDVTVTPIGSRRN